MPSLIWVFAGHTLILLVLSFRGSHVLDQILLLSKVLLVIVTYFVSFQRLSGENSPTKSPTEDVLNPLPKSNSHNTLIEQRNVERSQVSDRFRKSRSVMIENLHFSAPPTNPSGPPPPKSATLPPNFQTPIQEVVSEIYRQAELFCFHNGHNSSTPYNKLIARFC